MTTSNEYSLPVGANPADYPTTPRAAHKDLAPPTYSKDNAPRAPRNRTEQGAASEYGGYKSRD